jgi:hypothetical protein
MFMMTSVHCSAILGIYFVGVRDVNIKELYFLNFFTILLGFKRRIKDKCKIRSFYLLQNVLKHSFL